MPQLDPSSYASQIFWLLICFFSMMFIMSTFIIPKIADTRQQRDNKIDSYLHKAEKLQQKTEAAIKRYKDALNTASQKAAVALEETKKELNQVISKKQAELDKKLQKQIQAGEREISSEKEAALKEIKSVSTELTIEILRKLKIDNVKTADIKHIIEQEAK